MWGTYDGLMRRDRLVEARKAAGRSQEQVAELVGVDRTTIGTWERGEYTPQPHQRAAYAEAIGVTLGELAAMLSSAPPGVDEVPDWLVNYLGNEQSAAELRAHEPRSVHGLLQTPAYTKALVGRIGFDEVPESYLKRTVEQRLYRQRRVHDGSVALHVIQPESSLRLRVGTPKVMAEQFDFMADLAELPNVTVQVTTYDAGQYEARRLNVFVLMRHAWGNPRVHIEGYEYGRFITDAEEVAYFAQAFDQATRVARSPQDSVRLIRALADEWRTHA